MARMWQKRTIRSKSLKKIFFFSKKVCFCHKKYCFIDLGWTGGGQIMFLVRFVPSDAHTARDIEIFKLF